MPHAQDCSMAWLVLSSLLLVANKLTQVKHTVSAARVGLLRFYTYSTVWRKYRVRIPASLVQYHIGYVSYHRLSYIYQSLNIL